MRKVVWRSVLVVLSVGLVAGPVAAQTVEPHRQARVERQQRVRERLEARREALRQRLGDERFRRLEQGRLRLDRNADGSIPRREIARHRAALRRAIRHSVR
jgi:hypothetical protein